MPVSIIANLSSQYAQSAIKSRTDAVNNDTLQISSGSRNVGTVQDAAAVTVAAGLKIDNAGLASAKINAGSAISTLQIADGALGTASDILVRMQTLAVEASTGSLSDTDRGPIDLEFQALKTELGRLSAATQFNGVGLLNGQPNYALTGASDSAGDGISAVSFNGDGPFATGSAGDPTLRYSYDATTQKITLTRVDGATSTSQTFNLSALMDANAGKGNNLSNGQTMDLNFNTIGVTLTLDGNFDRNTSILPTAAATAGFTLATPAFTPVATNLDGAGVAGLNALAGGYDTTTGALTLPVVDDGATVTLAAVPGISYGLNGGAPGASGAASADLTGSTSVDIYVDGANGPEKIGSVATATALTSGAAASGTLTVSAGTGVIAGALQTGSADTVLNYQIGTGVVSGQDVLKVNIPAVNVASLGLTSMSVDTADAANASITALAAAVNTVSSARATVGAQESRLDSISGSIDVFSQNNESARSALEDVDVPSAITNLSDDQAALQAGISMLAQSNRIPNMLLSLLQGAGS